MEIKPWEICSFASHQPDVLQTLLGVANLCRSSPAHISTAGMNQMQHWDGRCFHGGFAHPRAVLGLGVFAVCPSQQAQQVFIQPLVKLGLNNAQTNLDMGEMKIWMFQVRKMNSHGTPCWKSLK